VIAALVHVTLPVMVIMLAAALAHIDRDYERAAESLGAGPIRAFLDRHAALYRCPASSPA
jgi:putative spermidine/putrescine transport system permease protein